MIDNFLDYAVANSAMFGVSIIVIAGGLAFAGFWAYGRLHERRMRRRGARMIR